MATTKLVVEFVVIGILTIASALIGADLVSNQFSLKSIVTSSIGQGWGVLLAAVFVSLSYVMGMLVNFTTHFAFRRQFVRNCKSVLAHYEKEKLNKQYYSDESIASDEAAFSAIEEIRTHIYQVGSDQVANMINFQWNILRTVRSTYFSIAVLSISYMVYCLFYYEWYWAALSIIGVAGLNLLSLFYIHKRQQWYVKSILSTAYVLSKHE